MEIITKWYNALLQCLKRAEPKEAFIFIVGTDDTVLVLFKFAPILSKYKILASLESTDRKVDLFDCRTSIWDDLESRKLYKLSAQSWATSSLWEM